MNAILHPIALAVSVLTLSRATSATPAEPAASAPAHANRAVSGMQPSKTALEFSAQPTTQEIFRARVFEEPHVIGLGNTAGKIDGLTSSNRLYRVRVLP